MDSFMILIILSVIFWPIMILLDAVIAFYLPAKRVETRLTSKETIKKLADNYGKAIFEAIKPQLKDERRRLVKYFNYQTKDALKDTHTHIDHIVSNDIPHIIDQKLTPVQQDINDHVNHAILKMQGIESRMGSVLQSGRNVKTSVKKAETIYKIQSLIQANPALEKQVNGAMMLTSLGVVSWSDLSKMVDVYAQLQGLKSGGLNLGTLQTMPGLQGSAPQETGLSSVQTQEWEARNLEGLTEAQQEKHAREELSALGVSKEVLDLTFNRRKKALLAKKVETGSEENGEKKEERETERKESRHPSIRDSPEDNEQAQHNTSPGEHSTGPGHRSSPGHDRGLNDTAVDDKLGNGRDKATDSQEDSGSSESIEHEERQS